MGDCMMYGAMGFIGLKDCVCALDTQGSDAYPPGPNPSVVITPRPPRPLCEFIKLVHPEGVSKLSSLDIEEADSSAK